MDAYVSANNNNNVFCFVCFFSHSSASITTTPIFLYSSQCVCVCEHRVLSFHAIALQSIKVSIFFPPQANLNIAPHCLHKVQMKSLITRSPILAPVYGSLTVLAPLHRLTPPPLAAAHRDAPLAGTSGRSVCSLEWRGHV